MHGFYCSCPNSVLKCISSMKPCSRMYHHALDASLLHLKGKIIALFRREAELFLLDSCWADSVVCLNISILGFWCLSIFSLEKNIFKLLCSVQLGQYLKPQYRGRGMRDSNRHILDGKSLLWWQMTRVHKSGLLRL